ncbi:nucleotidyltransferase family protein [candidate division KSB1 bacterium]|nr:nucleotidyltransferase family protein [candidate division KSB1 bacterium]
MQAIVLAAGYATRLYPLTEHRPKPLLKIGDKTILEYLLEQFNELQVINKVYIITNDRFYKIFTEWLSANKNSLVCKSTDIEIINDGTTSNETRLGAIGDIQFVLDHREIKQDLLVAAGDNVFTTDFKAMLNMFRSRNTDIFLAHPVENIEKLKRSGIMELDRNFRIIGFEEKPPEPKSNYVAPAFYMYKYSTLNLFSDYLTKGNNPDAPGNFTAWLYKRKPVYAYVMKEDYYDIGTLEAYNMVCEIFKNRDNN